MLKLIVHVALFFTLINSITASYICYCYCPNSYTYAGTAYSSTCSSSACASACSSGLYSCTSWSNTYGTCSGSSSGSSWYSSSYDTALSIGSIIGIVIGCLTGLAVLIAVIVILIICHKRKQSRVWAIQTQQQAAMQPAFINGPQQQWAPGAHHYPPTGPMNGMNLQYPPAYPSV